MAARPARPVGLGRLRGPAGLARCDGPVIEFLCREQKAALHALGVDYMQGYLVGKPQLLSALLEVPQACEESRVLFLWDTANCGVPGAKALEGEVKEEAMAAGHRRGT